MIARKMKKKYNFEEKLSELAEGDAAFKNEMLRLYIEGFQDIQANFRSFLLERKPAQLAFMSHKYRTTMIMFDLDELTADLEEGKQLLKETTTDKKRMEVVATHVEIQCADILSSLATIA